jgi:hypothetical protein
MAQDTDPDFDYRLVKNGNVHISWRGRHVVTLAGQKATAFRARIETAGDGEAQLLMARATGNFKRGNERNPGRPG